MIPKQAVDLILEFEGLDQPGRWPGGQSGITLGHGYDLGYYSNEEFLRDWKRHLKPEHVIRLTAALGRTGSYAQKIAKEFRDITITGEAAREVFESATLPKFTAMTRVAFPGVELLPPLVFGALVSLVFNRGAAMAGSRRREMLEIREAIASYARKGTELRAAMTGALLRGIAGKIREMKRLWVGQGLDGLLRRREAEADLVESAIA